jgi:acetoin utilization protein AcuB
MEKGFVTVDVNTPIMAALEIMKHNKVKRLPVTKKGKFVGLVTRSRLRDASPSEATTLSVYELNYYLSKMTVGDIMIKKPVTVSPEMPVEEALRLGYENGIGAFPVLEKGELVGIISETDFSSVMVSALGLRGTDSKRITIDASGKRLGFIKGLVEVLDSEKIPIMSFISIPKAEDKDGEWFLILRVKTKDASLAVENLKKEGYKVTDVT